MTDSYEFTTGKNFAELILKYAEPLKGTLPGAHATLQGLSQQVAMQAERNERHRIATILDATHPALQPIIHSDFVKDPDIYTMEHKDQHRKAYEFKPLRLAEDNVLVKPPATQSDELTLVNRFFGVVIRKILRDVDGFNAQNERVTSIFDFHHCFIKYTNDKLVIGFRGEGVGFDNCLIIGPDFILPTSNEHHVHSLYFNETFRLNFGDIGMEWLNEKILHPLRVHFEIAPIDYLSVYSERAIIENLRKIEGIDELTFVRKVTMYYPGDEALLLPETRIVLSYHRFHGDNKDQLIIDWHPHTQFTNVGMSTREAVNGGRWYNMPAAMQHWVFTNIVAAFTARLEEYRTEVADAAPGEHLQHDD